jgi:hypothetical protein
MPTPKPQSGTKNIPTQGADPCDDITHSEQWQGWLAANPHNLDLGPAVSNSSKEDCDD